MTTVLTIVMAVYGQPLMLKKWFETAMGYENSDTIRFVVVDDCGEPPATLPKNILDSLNITILRVTDDITWNQMGARNLGMSVSSGWCAMMDPDMIFSNNVMSMILEMIPTLKRGSVVRYGLQHMSGQRKDEIDQTSPNTYIIHKDDFDYVKGYDEDYAGNKGWSDVQLLDVLISNYKIVGRKDIYAQFYSTDQIPDAAVMSLDRSVSENKKKRLKKKDESRKIGGWKRWNNNRLDNRIRFKWTQVHPQL
jgi:hypothetical protein